MAKIERSNLNMDLLYKSYAVKMEWIKQVCSNGVFDEMDLENYEGTDKRAADAFAEMCRPKEEIARNEALIEILREKATYNAEASRGRALKARVKIQERLEARRIKAPFVDIKQPYINLSTDNEIEETTALKVENLAIAFDETLLENVTVSCS